jgi:hypothetical protein
MLNAGPKELSTLENKLHKPDVLGMRNYIYFSVIAAAILAMLSIFSGTAISTGASSESHTLVIRHTQEESHHEYKEIV